MRLNHLILYNTCCNYHLLFFVQFSVNQRIYSLVKYKSIVHADEDPVVQFFYTLQMVQIAQIVPFFTHVALATFINGLK